MFHRFYPFGVAPPPILCIPCPNDQGTHSAVTGAARALVSKRNGLLHSFVRPSSPGPPIGVSLHLGVAALLQRYGAWWHPIIMDGCCTDVDSSSRLFKVVHGSLVGEGGTEKRRLGWGALAANLELR